MRQAGWGKQALHQPMPLPMVRQLGHVVYSVAFALIAAIREVAVGTSMP